MDEKETFGKQMNRYYTTKLLNILWARELASKVKKDEILLNTVNPGFCYSGLHRHEKTGIIEIFLWALGWATQQGGHCLTDALVEHEDSHGAYLSEQNIVPPSNFVLSEEGKKVQKKIWDETLEIFRKEAPKASIPNFET